MEDVKGFRVISLNCWGLKHVSKFREDRLKAIAHEFGNRGGEYDIIALQEIWVEDDFNYLKQHIKPHLPYIKYYYSGIISGPGLAFFSRWPIVEANLYRFPINGRPSAFFRGDWFVGKSVASAVIKHPTGRKIEVLNAHMHAPYGPGDAAYTCHRTAQAWDMSRIAKRASDCGHVVLAMGDLNSIPDSLTYRLFQTIGGLSDSWMDKHGKCLQPMESLSLEDQIALAGTTCDSLLNTYREDRRIDEAKRLDYIFYDAKQATVVDSRVSFTHKIPGVGSFSDHFAVESDFVFDKKENQTNNGEVELEGLLTDVLMLIDEYRPTALAQKKWRIVHFWVSIVALIGILVAVFWGANSGRSYVGFILVFVSILITATGLLDGLIGFLFGRNETRALVEFESQVKLKKDTLLT